MKCVTNEKPDFSELREILPSYVPRNWKDWRYYIPYSPRTVANEDSKGRGPKKRMLIGNVVCYERDSLIEFLMSRSRVL